MNSHAFLFRYAIGNQESLKEDCLDLMTDDMHDCTWVFRHDLYHSSLKVKYVASLYWAFQVTWFLTSNNQ